LLQHWLLTAIYKQRNNLGGSGPSKDLWNVQQARGSSPKILATTCNQCYALNKLGVWPANCYCWYTTGGARTNKLVPGLNSIFSRCLEDSRQY
jgi:hypothetical protein